MTAKVVRANGLFTDNGSGATVVGADPWSDDSDATYISSDGDSVLAYTVGLEPLVGYVPGDEDWVYLNTRISMSGGGAPPMCEVEIFLATDAAGLNEIAAFSSGFGSGYAFTIPSGNDEIIDAYVPLRLTGFPGVTEIDVIDALEAGAYIDVNVLKNVNYAYPPVGNKIYELWLTVGPPTSNYRYTRRKFPTDTHRTFPPSAAQKYGKRRAGGYL